LNCTGGKPTADGQPIPQANVQIFLNTNITSRILGSSSDPWSEALLLIDEPGPSEQRYCTTLGGCPATGGSQPASVYDEEGNAKNVYQGRQSGANSIVWLGVPIDPPGSNATRIIRITNVRANANQLGVSSTLIPTQIVMFVSVTGTTALPINNPQQTVAYIQPGLSFSVRNVKSSYLQCVSWNSAAASSSSSNLSGSNGLGSVVRFSEGFASSFKTRSAAAFVDNDTSPTPVSQNTPGSIYFSESGFYNSSATSDNKLNEAGLASHGTRLMARFNNVPSGVALYATLYPVVSNGDPSITSVGAKGSLVGTSPHSIGARLVITDSTGGGSFSAVTGTNKSTANSDAATAPIALNNGAGMAVWEVMSADPLRSEVFEFGIGVAYAANTGNNLPGLGTATVAGSFAPLSTATTASTSSAGLPRFADSSSSQNLFSLSACTTNLLFVFLTNQAGFDSGIAISNTSLDPFGTATQAGACKLNYYGETTGGGAAPAAQTSGVIPAGKQLTAVLSTGGNYGIAATPGFQGYMIAQCAFQYAHGFAFISDVGANRVSEAYLALVLDKGLGSRTLFESETLGH